MQMCMILKLKVLLWTKIWRVANENSINQTLSSIHASKKHTLSSTHFVLKTAPFLVQTFKPLPAVVLEVAKIGPYPS